MKIKHDKKSDSKYIYIKRGKIAYTEAKKDWLIFDYSKNGSVLGIEILDASIHPVGISVAGDNFLGCGSVEFHNYKGKEENKNSEIKSEFHLADTVGVSDKFPVLTRSH
jgi:uncharacterized protein YuzE